MIANPVGWHRPERSPTPFRQFILKVHGRCNLRCDYCYMYTMADQRWRHRPRLMSAATIERTAARIAEHVDRHRLDQVTGILHGGEPLLAGSDRLAHVVRSVRHAVGDAARVAFSVQTNGTLVDEGFLRMFDELDVKVGVSLDGTGAGHDRHRRGPRGGSHERVERGLATLTLPRFRHLFAGLLCVVDVDQDPLAVYEALLSHEPPVIDLLLPHATWSAPFAAPPGVHAEWLIAIFDAWFHAPVRRTRIRLFEEIVNVLLGGESAMDGVGTTPAGMIVVETDGGIEQCDSLSVTFEGAADLGLNVFHDDFEAALHHPGTVVRQLGAAGIPTPCRPCRWARTCAGGLYPHRYRGGSGDNPFDNPFDNPSVYCEDLDRLFGHIRATLVAALADRRGDVMAAPSPSRQVL